MLKKAISSLLAFAIASTGLHADAATSPTPSEEYPTGESMHPPPPPLPDGSSSVAPAPSQLPDDSLIEEAIPEPPPPREVGEASQDAAQAAKTKKWQNIGIACAAVAVAALAIYLASINGGHDAKHYH